MKKRVLQADGIAELDISLIFLFYIPLKYEIYISSLFSHKLITGTIAKTQKVPTYT